MDEKKQKRKDRRAKKNKGENLPRQNQQVEEEKGGSHKFSRRGKKKVQDDKKEENIEEVKQLKDQTEKVDEELEHKSILELSKEKQILKKDKKQKV